MNPKFYRPVENEDLLGSATKAKELLGWEPKYTLDSLVEEMVLADIELVKNGRIFSNTYLDWLVDESEATEKLGITDGKDSDWLADDVANTEDSCITSGKGSDWSVAGSEKTEDSGLAESEEMEDMGTTNGKGSVVQDLNDREIAAQDTNELDPVNKGQSLRDNDESAAQDLKDLASAVDGKPLSNGETNNCTLVLSSSST